MLPRFCQILAYTKFPAAPHGPRTLLYAGKVLFDPNTKHSIISGAFKGSCDQSKNGSPIRAEQLVDVIVNREDTTRPS